MNFINSIKSIFILSYICIGFNSLIINTQATQRATDFKSLFMTYSECLINIKNEVEQCSLALKQNLNNLEISLQSIEFYQKECGNIPGIVSCQHIKDVLAKNFSNLKINHIFYKSMKTEKEKLLYFVKWINLSNLPLGNYIKYFEDRKDSWNSEIIINLYKNGFYYSRETIKILKKSKNVLLLEILIENDMEMGIDYIINDNNLKTQNLLLSLLNQKRVQSYLTNQILSKNKIHNDLIPPLLMLLSDQVLEKLADFCIKDKINISNKSVLKKGLFQLDNIYKLILFPILEKNEIDDAIKTNPHQLDHYIPIILNHYKLVKSSFFNWLKRFETHHKSKVFQYLAENKFDHHLTNQLLMFIHRNSKGISNRLILKIAHNLEIRTKKEVSLYFSTLNSFLPKDELKSNFLQNFYKNKSTLPLNYIFNLLDEEELLNVFLFADANKINLWQNLIKSNLAPSILHNFFKKYIKNNHSKGLSSLGKNQKYALKFFPSRILIIVLKLGFNKLNRKILNNIIYEKTSVILTQKQIELILETIQNDHSTIKQRNLLTQINENKKEEISYFIEVLSEDKIVDISMQDIQENLKKLQIIINNSSNNTTADIDNILYKMEKQIFNLETIEVYEHLRLYKLFVRIIKHHLVNTGHLNVSKGIAFSLMNLYNKKEFDEINIDLSTLETIKGLSFGELLKEYSYLKFNLANASLKALNKLSKEKIVSILSFMSNTHNQLSIKISKNRFTDHSKKISDFFINDANEYFTTTKNLPIDASLLCDTSQSCNYDFRFPNNISFYTLLSSTPDTISEKIQYPQFAQNGTKTVDHNYIETNAARNLIINSPINDILIINTFTHQQVAPSRPLPGVSGRALISTNYKQTIEVCGAMVVFCLYFKDKVVTRTNITQTSKNGGPGLDGYQGMNSPSVMINFLNNSVSPFSKVIIFTRSGDGGDGANGGAKNGGPVAGKKGAGGIAGDITPAIVTNNKYKIKVFQVSKSGKNGMPGKSPSK